MSSDRRSSLAPRVVTSNQQGLHPRLEEVVARHIQHPWQQPIREHNQRTFDCYFPELVSGEFIIDAGCGTGQSSLWLADRYPDKLVLGIDRSDHRLTRKKQSLPSNLRFIRADLEDWWRLTQAASLQAFKQTIFYPNPYPKASQLQRRWHAHPVFSALLACGADIEIRSNWETYIREASVSLALHRGDEDRTAVTTPSDVPITAFETKYLESGQALYQLTTGMKVFS
jgi:tRNA (guanine-N7-)-methyltransferase